MFSLQSRLLADQLLVPPKNQINKNDIINLCADVLYFFFLFAERDFSAHYKGKRQYECETAIISRSLYNSIVCRNWSLCRILRGSANNLSWLKEQNNQSIQEAIKVQPQLGQAWKNRSLVI